MTTLERGRLRAPLFTAVCGLAIAAGVVVVAGWAAAAPVAAITAVSAIAYYWLGGTDTDFGISVNGDAVEQVSLANVTTLNTAALIVAAINLALSQLTEANNKSAKAYTYAGRYFIAGPVDPAAPGTEAVVISDGLADNVADDLKIGLANAGTEELGSLSARLDAAGGGSASTSKFGSASFVGAVVQVAVAFAVAMPDTAYAVAATAVENTAGLANVVCWVDTKTVNGFNLNISAAPGGADIVDVDWVALR